MYALFYTSLISLNPLLNFNEGTALDIEKEEVSAA